MFYKNARIFASDFQFHMGAFEVKDGLFGEVLAENVPADAIDLKGATVIPGLVEVHSHGNSGADFSDGDYEGLKRMAKFYAQCGATSFAPASMTLPYETLAAVPFTLETAYAQGLKYTPDESGVELFRAEDITVIAQVISEEFYGRTARLLVKNDSDEDIIVEAENISVNGYTVDAWLYDVVCEDTVRYCQLDLFETGLAENGIDRIETITFRLNILDAEDYETVARSELLTVEVKG